jgi:hypothetical protein
LNRQWLLRQAEMLLLLLPLPPLLLMACRVGIAITTLMTGWSIFLTAFQREHHTPHPGHHIGQPPCRSSNHSPRHHHTAALSSTGYGWAAQKTSRL